MMKKISFLFLVILGIGAFYAYSKWGKIFPYLHQLTQTHVSMQKDLRDTSQADAVYVGSSKCKECHEEKYNTWSHSRHPKMIQDITKDSSVVVADFSKLPAPFVMGKETKEFYANGMGKKNRTQGNEFVHSIKGRHGITCINCHSPHSLQPTAEHNSGNKLCMKCHSFGSPIGPHQKDLTEHTHHKADSKGSLCVECHMPKVGRHTSKSPLTVCTHLFGFVTPKQTLLYGMPKKSNACFACHQDKTMQSLQKNLEEWGMVGWDKQ